MIREIISNDSLTLILFGSLFLLIILKKMGWQDPPLTTFRLMNLLTGAHYPIEKIQKLVGQLPFSMEDGVHQTLEWIREEKLIKSKN